MALDRTTIRIDQGEHVAILGPNGSGKSSFIKAITRECYPRYPQESAVRLLGEQIWHVYDLRVLLGIVSNDLMLSCTREVTGREIVLSGFFSSVELCPWHEVTAAMQAKTDEVLALLEVQHLADRPTTEMSSGEARRVLIGRALVHDPKALILDEPTTSLDLRAMYELRQTMRKLAQSGVSIILVTHNLPDLIPEISRVILLREGRVFQDGPKEQILTEDNLAALFGIPAQLEIRDGYYHFW